MVQFEVYRLVVDAVFTSKSTDSTNGGAVHIFSEKSCVLESKRGRKSLHTSENSPGLGLHAIKNTPFLQRNSVILLLSTLILLLLGLFALYIDILDSEYNRMKK